MKFLELSSLPDDLKTLCEEANREGADPKYEKVSLGAVDKFIQENDLKVEILGLLFNDGRRSGIMKCSACADSFQKQNGHPFAMAGVKGTYKYKSSVILSHLQHYHTLKSQRVTKKRKLSPSQPKLTFKGPLTAANKEKLLQKKVDFANNMGVPLSVLDSEDFKSYENMIWELSNNNVSDFRTIPSSASKFLVEIYFGN